MKRLFSILLILVLLCSLFSVGAFAANTAAPISASVLINGQAVSLDAFNIDGYNYFMLRDLAKSLSGTNKQFEVSWDAAKNAINLVSGKAYTPVDGELTAPSNKTLQSAELSSVSVYLDGTKIDLKAYNISNNNYFKLRDVASAINFGVGWSETTHTIAIDTSTGYLNSPLDLTVHYIDVGQGDSEFIVFPDGKTMLIDAGESFYGDSVVNYIKNKGYKKIDFLVATSPSEEHIGGMKKVLESLSIGTVYLPNVTTETQTFSDLTSAIKSAELKVTTAKAGLNIYKYKEFSADFIAPNDNNYSAFVKLTYNNNAFLFMGDAGVPSENEITGDVKADVLKVGNLNSNSSISQALLSRVEPKYAVISVGSGNYYGYSIQNAIEKLNTIGAAVFRTDKDGTVVFKSDGTNISVDKTPSTPSNNGTTNIKSNVVIASVDKAAGIVTIKNNGTTDVDLAGWKLVSVTGDQKYTFSSYKLKAGGKVSISSGEASGDLLWSKSNVWDKSSSDPAQLYDSKGSLVSSYTD